ncbi:MAG TPA: Re/Si-specific NAD(P)(+) transhydrogenase subunit alpha [Tepidisphaeraceae bacterium]|nr:Re/Si-specific NAD(P)(+) transhydrogenase subunit alpha [Tepidisphaeraceae bacterium]
MNVAVPREIIPGETRVALTPAGVAQLVKSKATILVESGAGKAAGFDDKSYVAKGAQIVERAEVFGAADILLQVRCGLNEEELHEIRQECLVIGFCDPLGNPQGVAAAARRGVGLIAMEMIPRITRAQAMDALSSQANIAGYKAVVLAAAALPKIFPMLMTAAGTLQASRAFVIGAGVAGLQAIATAKRLGAVVSAFDVRAAVKEQVQSVGAKFVELPIETGNAQDKGGYAKAQSREQQERQAALMARIVGESDIVITTAAVPGQSAPKLIPATAVAAMQAGSVIVDLAAERGGNCELTEPGRTVVCNGVTIIGETNLPATVPLHASSMYSNNLVKLLALLIDKEGKLKLDTSDEVIAGCLVAHRGEVTQARIRDLLGAAKPALSSIAGELVRA